jgi:hypothetical protein
MLSLTKYYSEILCRVFTVKPDGEMSVIQEFWNNYLPKIKQNLHCNLRVN